MEFFSDFERRSIERRCKNTEGKFYAFNPAGSGSLLCILDALSTNQLYFRTSAVVNLQIERGVQVDEIAEKSSPKPRAFEVKESAEKNRSIRWDVDD